MLKDLRRLQKCIHVAIKKGRKTTLYLSYCQPLVELCIYFFCQIGFGSSSYVFVNNLTIFYNEDGRDERMPCIRDLWIFVNIYFADFTLPSKSFARSSTIGLINLHGPHHSAQKSITATPPDKAVSLKFASVNSNAIVLFV